MKTTALRPAREVVAAMRLLTTDEIRTTLAEWNPKLFEQECARAVHAALLEVLAEREAE